MALEAVGIGPLIVQTLKTGNTLYNTVQDIRHARKRVQSLSDSLQVCCQTIANLEKLREKDAVDFDSESPGSQENDRFGLRPALDGLLKTFDGLGCAIAKYRKPDGRAKRGFFRKIRWVWKEDQIKSLEADLAGHQRTITLVLLQVVWDTSSAIQQDISRNAERHDDKLDQLLDRARARRSMVLASPPRTPVPTQATSDLLNDFLNYLQSIRSSRAPRAAIEQAPQQAPSIIINNYASLPLTYTSGHAAQYLSATEHRHFRSGIESVNSKSHQSPYSDWKRKLTHHQSNFSINSEGSSIDYWERNDSVRYSSRDPRSNAYQNGNPAGGGTEDSHEARLFHEQPSTFSLSNIINSSRQSLGFATAPSSSMPPFKPENLSANVEHSDLIEETRHMSHRQSAELVEANLKRMDSTIEQNYLSLRATQSTGEISMRRVVSSPVPINGPVMEVVPPTVRHVSWSHGQPPQTGTLDPPIPAQKTTRQPSTQISSQQRQSSRVPSYLPPIQERAPHMPFREAQDPVNPPLPGEPRSSAALSSWDRTPSTPRKVPFVMSGALPPGSTQPATSSEHADPARRAQSLPTMNPRRKAYVHTDNDTPTAASSSHSSYQQPRLSRAPQQPLPLPSEQWNREALSKDSQTLEPFFSVNEPSEESKRRRKARRRVREPLADQTNQPDTISSATSRALLEIDRQANLLLVDQGFHPAYSSHRAPR